LGERFNVEPDKIEAALQQLEQEARIIRASDGRLSANRVTVPVGSQTGWEAAVFDHFQALVSSVGRKLSLGAKSRSDDRVGGATLSFDVAKGHPYEHEVYGLLKRFRAEINEVWNRVATYNKSNPVDDASKVRVTFYMGQNVNRLDSGAESDGE
jgi:hypothetical protein